MTLLASLKRDQKGRKDGLVVRVLAAKFGKFSLTPGPMVTLGPMVKGETQLVPNPSCPLTSKCAPWHLDFLCLSYTHK